jgi:glycosyltransferase involved in cell wall biosynthesis
LSIGIAQEEHRQWRVLIYCDTIHFGGHEITLLEAIRYLAVRPEIDVHLFISNRNLRFIEALEDLRSTCTLHQIPYLTRPGDVFRVLFRSPTIRALKKEFAVIAPDLIVVSQGAIALCSCGLGAAKMLGIPLMSFLPMAHPVAIVRNSSSLTVHFQEFLYRQLYKIPDFFFTICRTSVNQLKNTYSIRNEKIFMRYFGLDIPQLPEPQRLEKPLFQDEEKHLGLIGRVEFNQKQQDFFVKEFKKCHERFNTLIVHVIGDGPDLDSLKKLVQELGLEKQVHFEGWVTDLTTWYRYLDMILIPSRFEGVPVVMLEAMYWGIPVVATDIDGMQEMLPGKWLFPAGNGKEMFERIDNILNTDQNDVLEMNHQRVLTCLNLESFKKGFYESVLKSLKSKRA